MEARPTTETLNFGSPVNTAGFAILGTDLGKEIECALQDALAGGALFQKGTNPLSIFRQALATSIRDIENHPRGWLLQDFLRKGPYEGAGEIPAELVSQRLSDAQSVQMKRVTRFNR